MVRISDILKKKIQTTPPREQEKPKDKQEPVSPPTPTLQIAKAMGQQRPQEMQIARAMKELEPDEEHVKDFYSRGVQLAKGLLINIEEKKPIELASFKDLLEEIINYFILRGKTIFVFFYDDYKAEEYLSNHAVNVMIMSLGVGLKLGYNKSRLDELGLAAFLHDIGMLELKEVYLQPRALSENEYNQIKKHPSNAVTIISQIKDIPQTVIDAVRQVHERMIGNGYPEGLKDGDICEYARIIGTVDVYEALTHSRIHRKQLSPYAALKEMLSHCDALFDKQIFKILIDQIGIYPVGSYVELNSNEIAKVVTSNDDFPLRPVVSVIFDAQKNRLENPRLVNLAKEINLFIKKPLLDEEVSQLIKEQMD